MPCVPFRTKDGLTGIMCLSRRRAKCACGRPGTKLCDWKMPDKHSGTCDRPLCSQCSHEPAPEKDLCPEHAAAWRARGKPAAPIGAPVQPSLFED